MKYFYYNAVDLGQVNQLTGANDSLDNRISLFFWSVIVFTVLVLVFTLFSRQIHRKAKIVLMSGLVALTVVNPIFYASDIYANLVCNTARGLVKYTDTTVVRVCSNVLEGYSIKEISAEDYRRLAN